MIVECRDIVKRCYSMKLTDKEMLAATIVADEIYKHCLKDMSPRELFEMDLDAFLRGYIKEKYIPIVKANLSTYFDF